VNACTPGPWTVGSKRSILGKAFHGVAREIVSSVRGGSPAAADANARLIASAPDLLKALRAFCDDGRDLTVAYKEALAAIAKAEGR
jgi:hypothetical protein